MSDSDKTPVIAEQSSEGPGKQLCWKSGGSNVAGSVKGRGVKRRHNSKTYQEKYEAILEVEKGGRSKTKIAEQYGIPANTLSTWLKNKEDIKSKFLSGGMDPERKKARKAKLPEVEEALVTWFKSRQIENVPIDGEMVKQKAREYASELGVSSEFSNGWLTRFKGRHGLVCKKISGECNSVDRTADEFQKWQSRLKTIISTTSPEDIFNADETAIFFRALPDRTLEFKSTPCHGGKVSKERLTVMVCANMAGTEKLPLLVLGKSKNPRCFKHVKSLPVQYRANKKAWMTGSLFTEWIRKVDDKYRRKNRRIVMIVDNCPAHPDITNLAAVTLVFLPPNNTSVTQPMDQGVIRALKVHYRKRVVMKKLRAIDYSRDYTITMLDAIHMMKGAWDEVKESTIINCYRRAGFTPDGPVQHEEVNEDEFPDDDIPLARFAEIMGSTNMDDFIDIDIDLQATESLTSDDILQDLMMKRSADDIEIDSSDEEDTDHSTDNQETINHQQATSYINGLRRYLEQQTDGDDLYRQLDTLDRYVNRKHLMKLNATQRNITSFFKKQ